MGDHATHMHALKFFHSGIFQTKLLFMKVSEHRGGHDRRTVIKDQFGWKKYIFFSIALFLDKSAGFWFSKKGSILLVVNRIKEEIRWKKREDSYRKQREGNKTGLG